jgi:hypothetical protein
MTMKAILMRSKKETGPSIFQRKRTSSALAARRRKPRNAAGLYSGMSSRDFRALRICFGLTEKSINSFMKFAEF